MKLITCSCILLAMIIVNFGFLAYFVHHKDYWSKKHTTLRYGIEDIGRLITIVIYDFEHFENDVVNTAKSILSFHPNIKIMIVSDELPYPPLDLPEKGVQLVVLNIPPNQPRKEGRPEEFIKTDYTLFLPDGYHMTNPKLLAQMVKKFEESDTDVKILAASNKHSSNGGPNCEKLVFDFRRWTLKYSVHTKHLQNGVTKCNSINGVVPLLMKTESLQELNAIFIRPFLKGLFIQSALRKWKVVLTADGSPFTQLKQLFISEHNRWLKNVLTRCQNRWKHENNRKRQKTELYKKFGIKKVITKEGSEEWYGCRKQSPRCFGTIINDVAAFIYKGRWTPPCCLRNLRETTRRVLTIFENHDIPYWLEGGSLLGAARNGDIIPWDYDVDIGMYKHDVEKLPNLKRAKDGEKVTDGDRFVWEKSREGDFYRVQFSSINHMHVDIFPFYEKNGIMTKDTWFKTHRQDTEFPVKYLQPLERMKFVGMNVMVPNNYKEFLEFKFGKGVIENPKYPNSQRVKKRG